MYTDAAMIQILVLVLIFIIVFINIQHIAQRNKSKKLSYLFTDRYKHASIKRTNTKGNNENFNRSNHPIKRNR